MRILVIHNHYHSSAPSGESRVVEEEQALLEAHGQRVVRYERRNDELDEYSRAQWLALGARAIWATDTTRDLRRLIGEFRPDVAHVHNFFPLISPSVYHACQAEAVPVVQTLHNYRLLCPAATFLRTGQVCEECVHNGLRSSVLQGCYRGSHVQTLPVALMLWTHRRLRTWSRRVNVYVALTSFCREKFIKGGLPRERIALKPNFLSAPPAPNQGHEGFALYIGRLTPEKSVGTILATWRHLDGVALKIIGDGASRPGLMSMVEREHIRGVEFLGRQPFESCMRNLRLARFLILSSIWYEAFPMTIVEAYAAGKPVIAPRLGSMAELVEDGRTGLLFEPGNPGDLADKVRWMVQNDGAALAMGRRARERFEDRYTPERNYELLMGIYGRAIEEG
jgi:glycosyltransferase involved in cell wall biosynthesis